MPPAMKRVKARKLGWLGLWIYQEEKLTHSFSSTPLGCVGLGVDDKSVSIQNCILFWWKSAGETCKQGMEIAEDKAKVLEM